jgi:hypothetical protein
MKKTMRFVFILMGLPFSLWAVAPEKNTDNKPAKNDLTAVPAERADTTNPWIISIQGRMSLNQVAFTNWAEGGESLISGSTYGNLKANYLKNSFKVDNFMAVGYGLTWNDEQGMRKMDDKLDVGTNLGYEAFTDFFYSLIINLKSQFSPGYKYPNDSVVVSRFFSPATLFLSMGLEYKPDENTSLFISPASGKFTFVLDQDLADRGAFGVTPAVTDTSGNVMIPGLNYNSKFGVNVILALNRDLMKNVNFDTKINLHNNYMDEVYTNRWNFDIDWETELNFKINSFLSSILYMHILYDDDVPIPTYDNIEGEKVQVGEGPKVQVKENFGIGIMIKV